MTQDKNNWQASGRTRFVRIIKSLEVTMIMTEINPLTSETLRFAVLFGAQAAFHNIAISALAFGGITLIWEVVAVISAADLLDTKTAEEVIGRVKFLIGKVGLSKLLVRKTSLLTDFGITLIAGSPATVILNHCQDPKRTARQNRELGYIMSIGAAVIATGQGAAIVAGIWHPSAENIAIAVIVIAATIATLKFVRKRLSRIRTSV